MAAQFKNDAGLTAEEIAVVRRPLADAQLLPSKVYTDAEIFELERERIFNRAWLPVCHVSQLAVPGQFVSRVLGGESVIAVRDREGVIRVLSNVCRHRNAVLMSSSGTCPGQRLACKYHGWTYTLDGRLMGAPFMEQTREFEKRDIRLPEFRSEIWQGFLFVNFDPNAKALAPQLTRLGNHLAPYQLDQMECVELRRRIMPWNWKISLENFSEAYHQPGIHPLTAEHGFPAHLAEYQDIDGPYGLFWLYERNRGAVPTFFAPPVGLTDHHLHIVTVFNVYPLLHCLTDPATPLVLDFEVHSQKEHELIWSILLPKGTRSAADFDEQVAKYRAFIEPILLEDVDICTKVGLGAHSRFTTQGRLSHMEKTVHQFHNWWLDQMLQVP